MGLCIVDYGYGNVAALCHILKAAKISHYVAADAAQLDEASHYILPGVGAFDPCMCELRSSGLAAELESQVKLRGKPLLGICIGMHLLASSSEEGTIEGFGWIEGCARLLRPSSSHLRVPHMGWNSLNVRHHDPILHGIDTQQGFYFLHSYYFDAPNKYHVVAEAEYGVPFPCIVRSENVIGVQFHPEKSHDNGVQLFRNFMAV